MAPLEIFAARLQWMLPQKTLSALVYRLMRSRVRWLKNLLIRTIGAAAGVNFDEAQRSRPEDFESFNAFFTRELKPGARPLEGDPHALACPCDGRISAAGWLKGSRILQAKGVHYELGALLAGDRSAGALHGGLFFTIYLAPRDYHRVHMPLDGRLLRMIHVPGKLFSVAPYTVRRIPGLFALNERVVSIFDTEWGPMAQVLVGAILVGSMETVWAGEVTPAKNREVQRFDYAERTITLGRGEEMGRFNMGSTVVLILPPDAVIAQAAWARSGSRVRLGQTLARMRRD